MTATLRQQEVRKRIISAQLALMHLAMTDAGSWKRPELEHAYETKRRSLAKLVGSGRALALIHAGGV